MHALNILPYEVFQASLSEPRLFPFSPSRALLACCLLPYLKSRLDALFERWRQEEEDGAAESGGAARDKARDAGGGKFEDDHVDMIYIIRRTVWTFFVFPGRLAFITLDHFLK